MRRKRLLFGLSGALTLTRLVPLATLSRQAGEGKLSQYNKYLRRWWLRADPFAADGVEMQLGVVMCDIEP